MSESVSPRPSSPAEEAEELLSPTEDDECKKSLTSSTSSTPQNRRKSSVWKKALNIKKQISKVNIKIGEGVRRGSVFFGPTEGTPLSPVEMSPDLSPNDGERPKSDYVQQLENEIVQSLSDLEVAMAMEKLNEEPSASNSDHESESDVAERRSSVDPDSEWKKRIVSQPQCLQTRRSDVSEELAARASVQTNLEGARQARPADLPLFDENGRPILPTRLRPNDPRNQRLLSVPNIKYNRTATTATATGDIPRPKPTRKDPPSSFAGNLMRRFSKYLHRYGYEHNNVTWFSLWSLNLSYLIFILYILVRRTYLKKRKETESTTE